MFKNTLRLECRKAVCNPFFFLAVLIGVVMTFFSLITMAESFARDMAQHRQISEEFGLRNPLMQMESLFNHWIGGEGSSAGASDYFFLFPLLICIPYGWSYCSERRSGYIKNMVIRTGKMQYYLAKYAALFLSGGLAMTLPLLINFLAAAMIFPAVKPDPSYMTAYGIGASSFLSMLFYGKPFLYIGMYLLVDFVFCGLIACLCFAVSDVVKNPIAVTLLPFFFLLGVHYFCDSFVYRKIEVMYTELSPMHFLRPIPMVYDTSGLVIFVWGSVLFAVTFFTAVIRRGRHEIY
ncbi:hypothetical protein ACPW7J_02765 [Ihubacter sp. rT4E-8]|uniref:hypothetical protein n=1 Tax=Ihubacter sp. rT4E-8 TaxID=3242369 RepID=UPI003CF40B5C